MTTEQLSIADAMQRDGYTIIPGVLSPEYVAEAKAFAEPTQAAIEAADPTNPGVQPRPAQGIQFVGIPEFPDLGTQVSQDISAAIAGQISVDDALAKGQTLAESTVTAKYKK